MKSLCLKIKHTILIFVLSTLFVLGSVCAIDARGVAQYYARSSVADHGGSYTGSVRGLGNAVGATNYATIVLSHDGLNEFTDYVFSTNYTFTYNLFLKIEEGARVSIAAGKSIAIDPSHIICGKRQHIKTGAGTFAWTIGGTITPEMFGAKRDNGVTDSTDAIQEAATSMVGLLSMTLDMGATDTAYFYKITDTIAINARSRWSIIGPGRGGSQIVQYTDESSVCFMINIMIP